jgi:dUTP pyrophosphatase
MKIDLFKYNPDAQIPVCAHIGDAGNDLFSVKDFILMPGERVIIPTGIGMKIPDGFFGMICDRSGLAAKQGITVLGGIIDSTYTGEIKVILLHTTQEKHYSPVHIHKGDKIAQLIIMPYLHVNEWNVVEKLEETKRGDKGFGSTG